MNRTTCEKTATEQNLISESQVQHRPAETPSKEESSPWPISLFKCAQDNIPKSKTDPVRATFELLFAQHVRRGTKDGPCFSPVQYLPGTKRGNKNVAAVTALVADVDDGTPPTELTSALLDFCYIMHSSHSHTPERPKYRIIVPLRTPMTAAEFEKVWPRWNHLMGRHVDSSTKDPARLYYLPACPVGAQGVFSELHEGTIFDVSLLPELPVPKTREQRGHGVQIQIHGAPGGYEAPTNDISTMFQRPGLDKVKQGCAFMRNAALSENQPDIPEPLWRALLSNAAPFQGGKEFAHEASCAHPSYDSEATDDKQMKAFTGISGTLTCKYIQDHGSLWCPSSGQCVGANGIVRHPSDLANKPAHTGGIKKTPLDQCEIFMNRHYPHGLLFVAGCYHAYERGAYAEVDEMTGIDQKLLRMLGPSMEVKEYNEALRVLPAHCAAPPEVFQSNSHLVCLENGALNLRTSTLIPHDPAHFLRNKLPITYAPAEGCPQFLAFLDAVFRDDPDRADKIAFLQTYMGYLLVPDVSAQIMVWLLGHGANGKSVLMDVIRALVGQANVSNAMMDRFSEGPVRAELDGKLMNISADLPSTTLLSDGYIKAIVAGDMIEASRKYKPSFSFKPHCRLLASMNNLPKTNDTSHGIFRRIVILEFNRVFAPDEQDRNLTAKLLGELSGILNWALQGLAHYRTSGRLVSPPSSARALDTYRSEVDVVKQFVEDKLELTNEDVWIESSELYRQFTEWCMDNGFSQRNSTTFGRELSRLGVEKKKSGSRKWRVKLRSRGGFRGTEFLQDIGIKTEGLANAARMYSM